MSHSHAHDAGAFAAPAPSVAQVHPDEAAARQDDAAIVRTYLLPATLVVVCLVCIAITFFYGQFLQHM